MSAARAYVEAVTSALAGAGDPDRAVQQQRYMKSELPFRGLSSPELRSLLTPILRRHLIESPAEWERAARSLWDDAHWREEWYAALALLRHRPYRAWAEDPTAMPLYEHLIRVGAWWDVVDEIAAHLVGGVLSAHPEELTALLRRWAVDDHLWVRRTAILAQLRRRGETDQHLLAEAIEANLEGTPLGSEFFIRKAIGWALREQAKHDAVWVLGFVAAHEDRMSGLSRREALKHLA